jgi:ABC-type amino acid transport substrate-binding protein
VNEILYTLQEDGTIKELKEKWFGKEQWLITFYKTPYL